MGKRIRIGFLLLLLLAVSCVREDLPMRYTVPEGTPVTLTIGFNATTPVDVRVSTKAEASRADESRVHDLYVLIFDSSSGTKKYGRYFSNQHKWDNLTPLTSSNNENEGWYVRNKTLDGAVDPVTGAAVETTVGAVRIATAALADCTLVLLANVDNTLISLGGEDPLDALNSVTNYTALKNLPVRLEQDIIVRNDLFLMQGEIANLDMTSMTWDTGDTSVDGFGTTYRVTLSPIDAKVKFRIKVNSSTIRDFIPHKWSVSNLPSSCYLYSRDLYAFPSGDEHFYFDTEPVYFEGEETDAGGTWQTFTFYMLESCLKSNTQTPNYSARELQTKHAAPVTYTDETGTHTIQYVSNGTETDKEWAYAPANSPYVTFSASITLKDTGISNLDDNAPAGTGWDPSTNPQPVGVTGEMSYTVHLGNFSHTGDDPNAAEYDTPNPSDYNTIRGHFYTYDITINNAANLYAEVKSFHPDDHDYAGLENQPGQEGSLLLNSGGVVNCDAHYEYRSIEFAYNSTLAGQLSSNPDYHVFSWYVRTPFTKDGYPTWDSSSHRYEADSTKTDFLWVKFAINALESGTDPKQSTYSERRIPYPGNNKYNYDWYPGADLDSDGDTEDDIPVLLDINQLINYIYYNYKRKIAGSGDIFDQDDKIRATAFVNEYYYEWDPFTGQVNPNLWRNFVNADPREMHILSDVQSSRDRMSNLINSSHSIIQRSIQTIYNVDSPELNSIWGVEHKDEVRETKDESSQDWTGWPWGISSDATINAHSKSEENGRLNSAALWGLYPSPDSNHDEWVDFLEYAVINSIPELDADHRKMAYSCLTRNRDNDGDGVIDPEEIRWYMASINQLKGMWVGNESLSTTARVYQPWGSDWRAHVISSTCPSNAATPKVLNAEEGVATFDYTAAGPSWAGGGAAGERLRESVRCVRNVGTYTVGSKLYDISSAPYAETPDQYYTVEEHKDPNHSSDSNYSTYTIQFRRLDPRSIREYTNKELPFHDEKSSNNHVYLELHVQSRASRLSETPDYRDVSNADDNIFPGNTGRVDVGTINEEITNDGNNKYCPTGYRLPNQTELAIMTLVLPATYWNSPIRVPTRTYFSHGMYAPVSQQKTGEEKKLSFAYSSTNIFLPDRNDGVANKQFTNRIRCVRDNELTGTITGKMYLASTRIMQGEQTTLTFNFSSTAAAFDSGRLYLCYTDRSGNPVETEIALDKQPSGLNYRESQTFTAPTLASLDPLPGDLPVPMQLKLVLSNVRENSQQTFYTSFTLVDLNIFCDFEIMPGHDDTYGFPINVTAETTSGDATIATLKLYGKTDNGDWSELQDLSTLAAGKTEFERTVYFNDPLAEGHVYSFKAVATSSSQTYTTGMKSMEIVKLDYSPNTGVTFEGDLHAWGDSWWNEIKDGETIPNAYRWHNSLVGHVATEYVNKEQRSEICNPWAAHKVDNVDFSRGDFIEAGMDLINCVFIRTVDGDLTKTPMKDQVIGLDNIFSIGKNSIDWGNNASDELHFYYPAHTDPSDDQLQIDPVYLKQYSRIKLGGIAEDNGKRKLILCFDRNGAKYNGASVSGDSYYTSVVSDLTACHSLYIGALEGSHLSRATYEYVRVVRNDLSSVSSNVTGGFNEDPQPGGNL